MNQIEELKQQVHDVRELLEKKHPSGREVEGMDELTKRIVELEKNINHPVEKKMVWAVPDASGKLPENGISIGKYLKAVRDPHLYPEVMSHVKAILEEGTAAQGGYTVPQEYATEIIKLERGASIIRQLGRDFPMGTLTRNVPRQLTNVTVTWTDEGSAKTPTKPTFDRLQQVAKKLAAIVKFSDEVLEDNNVNLDRFIMEIIADGMALEEDRIAFVGNTGAGDPFMGVNYAVGVNVVTQAGANLAGDDVINLIFGIGAGYRNGGTLVTSSHGLRLVMQLKDANGQYLWQAPAGNQPAKIWTFPYEVSDQIPSTLGTGTQTAMLFGNWNKYYYISDRGGYEVKSSISATDLGTNESAFMEDETWYRFKKRMSLDVALPVAFSRMNVG